MTIPATASQKSYAGDGVSVAFTIPFIFDIAADIKVIKTSAAGLPSALSTGFSITGGGGSTGTCTMSAAPAIGETLTILDDPALTQSADYTSNDAFPAETHEKALDRTVRLVKRLYEITQRSIRVQDGDLSDGSENLLPIASVRALKVLGFDAQGNTTVLSGTGGDAALRTDIGSTTASIEGDRLVGHRSPGTGAIATSVYAALRGLLHVSMFGAVGDGVTDDRAAVQAAIDAANTLGGGRVVFDWGKTYRLVCGGSAVLTNFACAIVKAGVTLYGPGATLSCEVGNGNQVAVWLFGDKAKIEGLAVNAVSSGVPSLQLFYHSAVAVGVPNNCGDTVASPSAGQFMSGWAIKGCTLSTSRIRCAVVQVQGGANNGVIEDNVVPSSATHSGFYFDWGNLGTVSSAAIPTTRTSFDGGTAVTTHPNNIKIRNNRVGTLSAAVSGGIGTIGVRVSGCYAIDVDGLKIDSITHAAFFHTAGDMSMEFAAAAIKRFACKGNRFRNITLESPAASVLYGGYIDTLADNVYREQFISGYVPLMNPLNHGDVVVENCALMGANTDNTFGLRILKARGVVARRDQLQRWYNGVLVDEFTQDILIDECDITANRREGVAIGQQALREDTKRVHVRRCNSYGNGTDATNPGIRIFRGRDVWLEDNVLGQSGETTQNFGIAVNDIAGCIRGVKVTGNQCIGATSGAWAIGASAPTDALMYRVMDLFVNNTVDAGVKTLESGQAFLPLEQKGSQDQRQARWLNPNSSAPVDGTWYRGDILEQTLPVAAGSPAHSVTTSGTFGTLAAITNGATTNGSRDITCSLTGITVTTTAQGYSVVVSSATGIRAGMKCSIAAAGITDATIISVSGTTLQLDTQAGSSQVGAAFTTCGLIEGEVISINTGTPVTQAVVMKIAGTTVTLDRAPASTEAGRTITYTTPVFKTWPAIAA